MRLFGTSGIRGIVGEKLTPEFCEDVGRALGATLLPGSKVCLTTDTRLSRELVGGAVISGLRSAGIDIIHLGILPTPGLAFLTRELDCAAGLMITASHNPPEYNGIKVFNRDTIGYSIAQEDEIESILRQKQFRTGVSPGALYRNEEAGSIYLDRLVSEFSRKSFNRNLRVVVDPGSGAASGFALRLLSEVGLNVIALNDDPDGRFPGRPSEPTGETLKGTIAFLREKDADLAVCFDGDADRVVFCDREGFLGFTEMVAFIARIAVEESGKKKVAATIEVGKLMDLALEDLGGEVVRGKVGDVYLAHLVRESGAAIGVEDVGVYILPEMGWYPESMAAALMLLSHIESPEEIREFLVKFPRFSTGKAKVQCPGPLKDAVMSKIEANIYSLDPRSVNTLDGVRLDFDDSWMLIRASGTEPVIRVMTESVTEFRARELLSKGVRLVEDAVKRVG
ncbi:MAG: phosphoglucosamine mutase [Chloroflexi bacterium]|nr:phosphoglucosamine mutase [Chloroflexota bacterium]